MQSFKKKRRWLFGLLFSFLLSSAVIYLMGRESSAIMAKKQVLELVLLGMEDLVKLWQEGEDSLSRKHCPGRCGASFLQCLFKKRDQDKRPHLLVRKEGREFGIFAKKQQGEDYYRIITRENTEGVSIPSYAVFLELSVALNPDIVVPVLLEDSCNDVYLPQRIYSYGPLKNLGKEDFRWDNFSTHVYLDKRPVNFLQIADWIKFSRSQKEISKDITFPKEAKKFSLPASRLSKRQMENYCAFRGGQLLQAHYYDAATFYPGDVNDLKPIKNIRGPYPWANKSKSFLVEDESYCHKVYSRECLKTSYEDFQAQSVSWIGMFEILGGYPEALENKIEPKKNLKASSFLFPANSSWHVLGKRAYWNGIGFTDKDFKWEEKGMEDTPELEDIQVSFRCMRFVYD